MTQLRQQQDRLLNLRLLEEINADTFASKGTELRDRIAQLTLQVEAADRDRGEQAELAIKAFELSQALVEKWLAADFSAKRRLLEIVFLNFKLDGVTLCYEMRKPFDGLVEGLAVSSHRGDRRWTFPNESRSDALLLQAITQRIEFTADAMLATTGE